jgi:hypothetical protein
MAAGPTSYNPDEPGIISKCVGSWGMLAAWAIALAVLTLHIYYNRRYGYFRDEFDYLSCGDHLAWGYVDQPPLVPFLARMFRVIFGDSLPSIRLLPALASSLLIVQTAAIARELGGRTFALILSAAAVFAAPQYLSNGSLLTTNCLEPLLWMGCAYFLILAIKRNEARYWLWFGVIAGIGLEEKYTIGLFVLAVVIGLLLTEQRSAFLTKWLWLGGLAAFLIFLPNLLWNWHNDWPFAQLMHNIRAEGRDVVLGPFSYFSQQMLLVNPFATPIWLAGLFALLLWPRLRPYRVLGWSYLICYGALFALHGKNYYLAPIYPMLLAAGAAVIEAGLDCPALARPRLQWLRPVIIAAVVASGLCLLPITVPVFSPEDFLGYMKRLPFKLPVMEHSHERATLPQWYADQFGWKEIEEEAALAWKQIPVSERADCAIFAQDYGQAGAVDFFGRTDRLPPALSGDRTYFLWGPRQYSGNCMVIVDDSREKLEKLFEQVEYVGTSADNPWALEKQLPVYICKDAKFGSLNDLWPRLKHWR